MDGPTRRDVLKAAGVALAAGGTVAAAQEPAAAAPPTVSISSPSAGGVFNGNSDGNFAPTCTSGVTVEFWQFGPPAACTPPDRTANAVLGRLSWTASMNVTGLTTTTGFLRATNDDGGAPAEVANLQVS